MLVNGVELNLSSGCANLLCPDKHNPEGGVLKVQAYPQDLGGVSSPRPVFVTMCSKCNTVIKASNVQGAPVLVFTVPFKGEAWPHPTETDLVEAAWGLIANAGGTQGNWETCEAEGWEEAASRWRDRYHEYLRDIQTQSPPGL